MVVGYDTRFLSEDFAAAAAGTLAQAGVRSRLAVAAVPTPTVAHAVLHHRAAAGITITASHNPAPDNGLKLSGPTGGPALPEVTRAVEARVAASADPGGMPIAEARAAGLVEPADFAPAYLDQCRRLVDLDGLRRARLRVVVDVMYGPARGYLDRLLEEAGVRGHAAPRGAGRHLRRPSAGAGRGAPRRADRGRCANGGRTWASPPTATPTASAWWTGTGPCSRRTRSWRSCCGTSSATAAGGAASARSVATTHLLDALAARHGVRAPRDAGRVQVPGRPDHAGRAPCSAARSRAA